MGVVKKVGIMGGTFDPVHMGHIGATEEAYSALGLSLVIMIPAGHPLLKPHRPLAPASDRLRMLELAIAGKPFMRVSDMEMNRSGPSYTVDTISQLKQRYGDDELYFILGWGSLAQLPQWREPSRIIEMCRLVAVPRPGYPRPILEDLERKIPGISHRVVFLDKPCLDISASAVRERVAHGRPLDGLVPAPVAAYIKEHKLYLNLEV